MITHYITETIPILQRMSPSFDKIKRSERNTCLTKLVQSFELSEASQVIFYSAKTHEGRIELWKAMREKREAA